MTARIEIYRDWNELFSQYVVNLNKDIEKAIHRLDDIQKMSKKDKHEFIEEIYFLIQERNKFKEYAEINKDLLEKIK